MGRKKTPGLKKRGQYWHIDKWICGQRLQESTGTQYLEEAERYLNQRIQMIREASVYGVRPKRTFKEAATKFLLENQHKASIHKDAMHLKLLCQHIGDLTLDQVHSGVLQPFVEARLKQGRKPRTINHALQVVRHILNLAALEWRDEQGLTWLLTAPRIKMLKLSDAAIAYPLNWDEQNKLFAGLPETLRDMALFKVNTGCREQEVCQLRWEWEVKVEALNTSVFIIPLGRVKNRMERLVILNQIAQSVIEKRRNIHSVYVFAHRFRGEWRPYYQMNNSAWQQARKKVGLKHVRVHDLKHTFGRRLRAAGVSFEDRQDLLGHKSGRITTHYSAAELKNLIDAANKVCHRQGQGPVLTLLRQHRAEPCREAPCKIPTLQPVLSLRAVK